MTNKIAAEKLAYYLVCEKIKDKAFEKEVVERVLLNPAFELVCEEELKKLWDSIPNTNTTIARGGIKALCYE